MADIERKEQEIPKYVKVREVMQLCEVSESRAYRIMQQVRSVADWDRLEAERERRKNGANRKGPGPDHGQNTGPPGAEGAGAGIGGFHPAEGADE